MRNTKIPYMYRDGANFKTFNTVVVQGAMSKEQVEELEKLLFKTADGIFNGMPFFFPGTFGWPELNPVEAEWDEDLDHDYHEILFDEIVGTEEEPTEGYILSVEEMFKFLRDVVAA